MSVNRHYSQMKHGTAPQNQPMSQVAGHQPGQQPCTHVRYTWPPPHPQCPCGYGYVIIHTYIHTYIHPAASSSESCTCVWGGVSGCASCAVRLCVRERSDGWLIAWDLCECLHFVPPQRCFSLSLVCNYSESSKPTPLAPGGRRRRATPLNNNKKNRKDVTPDAGGHRPQRPCAQGFPRAKQDEVQASAPGQNRTHSVGGATISWLVVPVLRSCQSPIWKWLENKLHLHYAYIWTDDQAGRWIRSVPTQTTSEAGGCTLQTTHQARTPRQDPTRQLHEPRERTVQGSCRVEQKRDNTSRCSNSADTTCRKRRQQHRLRVDRPRTHP